MKDSNQVSEVHMLLDAWSRSDTADIAASLHDSFQARGMEDGLFIQADAATYLRFLERAARDRPVRAKVEWTDVRQRVAVACLVQQDHEARRTILLTMMAFQTGWRVVTATFGVEAGPFSITGHQVPLQ